MAEIFDLDAIEAETHEDKELFQFKFGGQQFTLPNVLDQRAIALDAKGATIQALQLILGPEQLARLDAVPAVMDVKRLRALLAAWLEHLGENLGESVASTDSSKSTERPSKRTSSGTTKSRSQRSSPANSDGLASVG